MPKKVHPGDRVILGTTDNEVYEGNVVCISHHSVELYDVYFQTEDLKYPGNIIFYREEVASMSRISVEEAVSSVGSEQPFDGDKKIRLDPDEFARLKEMYLDFIFVHSFDEKFQKAVNVLSERESVAVVGLGNRFSRGKPLSLLLMADFKQVFIFDMLFLIEVRGLRDILESKYITKVVHDGTALFDCLYHKYGVEMCNIFDTQIFDSMMEEENNRKKVKRNIAQCLQHHFNFPLGLLSAAVDDMNTKIWQERPVTKSSKIKAAQLVTYLITLRDHLLQKHLQNFSDNVNKIYDKYKQMSDTVVLNKTLKCHKN